MIDYLNDSNREMKIAIANRIRKERKETISESTGRPLSQDELADIIKYSKPTVVSWEKADGKNRIPNIEQLLALCSVFHCEVGYLLCEYDTKTRVAADIQKETGLTEENIKVLHTWNSQKESSVKNDPNNTQVHEIDIFNHLVMPVLDTLYTIKTLTNRESSMNRLKKYASKEVLSNIKELRFQIPIITEKYEIERGGDPFLKQSEELFTKRLEQYLIDADIAPVDFYRDANLNARDIFHLLSNRSEVLGMWSIENTFMDAVKAFIAENGKVEE